MSRALSNLLTETQNPASAGIDALPVAEMLRVINAADQVASGNFYAQVPARKSDGDLAHLSESFNKMTQELRRQHDGLMAASDLIDRRRRFTEACCRHGRARRPHTQGRSV